MECKNLGIGEELYAYLTNSIAHTGYYNLNRIEVCSLGAGQAELIVTTGAEHCNPMGMIHGGVYATLLDAAMGNAIRSLGQSGVTCSMTTNFITGAKLGKCLLAQGKVIRLGRKIAYAEATISCDGLIVATALGTFSLTGVIALPSA